ncbi:MAG TPA: acyl-CoA thioesterase, partial [Anaeromyxobacter sp.]|nr:acyl-CoA thioesterase [Anaeromyxobacter sp.]
IERGSRDRSVRAISNSCLFALVNVDREMRQHDASPVYTHHVRVGREASRGAAAARGAGRRAGLDRRHA